VSRLDRDDDDAYDAHIDAAIGLGLTPKQARAMPRGVMLEFKPPKPDCDARPMTRDEIIAHRESIGAMVRDCAEFYVNPGAFAPGHQPSDRCESGKRPHCTCDTCF
jgi:hypothetical protein